jgi:hypothetical protein
MARSQRIALTRLFNYYLTTLEEHADARVIDLEGQGDGGCARTELETLRFALELSGVAIPWREDGGVEAVKVV